MNENRKNAGTPKKAGGEDKLTLWQRRLSESDGAWAEKVREMDEREKLYNGKRELKPLVPGDTEKDGTWRQTSHVRNIIFENIESQVSSAIPQPKVTPRRKEDEHLAQVIEHFLRNELDRLPMEQINDLAERTVPLQGGVGFLLEWDNTRRTHSTIGETVVSLIHPKQFKPQPGVYTGIEDMDWFILAIPTTKEAVRRKYGVSVADEGESEPQVRSADDQGTEKDAVTEYIGYQRNDEGGIDRYCWVNDVELEDLENYQGRRRPVCRNCGRVQPFVGQELPREDGESGEEPRRYRGGACPWCGNDAFVTEEQTEEEVWVPIMHGDQIRIPGATEVIGEDGTAVLVPTRIPYYRPDMYPILLQRSVTVYGQLLGNSDVDVIRDQQNTINRMEQKIIDRLIKAGTRITLPDKMINTDPTDGERWFLESPAQKQMIDVYEFTGNLQYELTYLANVYEEARQILGITDSFQGRRDTTATSGKAKEFSAAQAAGRLESKRVMKQAVYAALFEAMFKFWLAYSDEPRPVHYKDFKGEDQYEVFDRYDFLCRDVNGEWYWNDQFLFSCDSAAPLASNREAMWQETRANLQGGAFGDPSLTETLILFWAKMEELHYPGAGQTKKFLEEKAERERQQQIQAKQLQHQAAMFQGQPSQPELPENVRQAIEERARADAYQAVMGGQ